MNVAHGQQKLPKVTSQRAALGAELANMPAHRPSKKSRPIDPLTQPAAAAMVGVSAKSVKRAAEVKAKDKKLFEQVKADAIEGIERKKAKERQAKHGDTAPGRKKNTSGKIPEVIGQSRDIVAGRVGLSAKTLERARAVVAAANAAKRRTGTNDYGVRHGDVRKFKTESEKREHVIKLNLCRRHLSDWQWGEAFERLLEEKGVKAGSGARNDLACATVAQVAGEVGVPERTAKRRLAAARKKRSLPKAAQKKVESGELELKDAIKEQAAAEKAAERETAAAEAKSRTPDADYGVRHGDVRKFKTEGEKREAVR